MVDLNKVVSLAILIDEFGEKNTKLKELKKACDERNAEIKEIMSSKEMKSFSTDRFTASYTIKESVTVNEDLVANILANDWINKHGADSFKNGECPYIIITPIVNQDALEAAIYKGEIDPAVLSEIKECSSVKKIPTLTVKQIKTKKEA